MSVANIALLYNLGLLQFPVYDNLTAGAAATQNGAPLLIGELCRCTSAVGTGSFMLKSLLTEDGPPLVFVVNDSANTINVYPFVGEKINGGTNTALAIPAGQSGIFISVPNAKGATLDWRSAVIP
jgi:hypothetical protein